MAIYQATNKDADQSLCLGVNVTFLLINLWYAQAFVSTGFLMDNQVRFIIKLLSICSSLTVLLSVFLWYLYIVKGSLSLRPWDILENFADKLSLCRAEITHYSSLSPSGQLIQGTKFSNPFKKKKRLTEVNKVLWVLGKNTSKREAELKSCADSKKDFKLLN
jgi:hypothetical protein